MVATRFAVAIHLLLILAEPAREPSDSDITLSRHLTTSGRLAERVNTNPVVVRRITGQLARAGLIRVRRGPGGAELARPAGQITLEDVWAAVNSQAARPLIPMHGSPAPSLEHHQRDAQMRGSLATAFQETEAAFRHALARQTLAALLLRARSEGAGS